MLSRQAVRTAANVSSASAIVVAIIIERLRIMLTDRRELRRLAELDDASAAALQLAITTGNLLAAELDAPARRRQVIDDEVAISLTRAALLGLLRIDAPLVEDHLAPALLLTAPAVRRRVAKEVRLVVPADDRPDDRDTKVAALLAEAMHVREVLLVDPERSIDQMARETGRCRSARLLRLAFVAPQMSSA